MSLLDYKNFEHLSTAILTSSTEFNSTAGTTAAVVVQAGVGRDGLNGLQIASSKADWNDNVLKTLTPSGTTAVLGFRLKTNALPADGVGIASISSGGSAQVTLVLRPDGTISVCRHQAFYDIIDAATYRIGVTSVSVAANTSHRYELKVVIGSGTSGSVELQIDGAAALAVTGINTNYTGSGTWNGYYIGCKGNNGNPFVNSGVTMIFNDITCCDGTVQSGPNPFNTFLGNVKVDTVWPTADGFYTAFTPDTPGAHYTQVDEHVPDDDTTYLSGTAVNQRDSWLYTLPTPSGGGSILATRLAAWVKKTDTGSRSIVDFVRAGGSNFDGTSDKALSTTYRYEPLAARTASPVTGLEWVPGGTVEMGIKVSV